MDEGLSSEEKGTAQHDYSFPQYDHSMNVSV